MGYGWPLGQRPIAIGLLLSLSTSVVGATRTVVLASDNTYLVVPEAADTEAAAEASPPTAEDTLRGTTLRIGGSPSLASLNLQLGRAFSDQYADTTVELVSLEPEAALAAVAAGRLDLAAIQRPLTSQERLQGLRSHPIQGDLAYVYAGPDPDPALRAFFGVATDPLNREIIDQALASTPVSADADSVTPDDEGPSQGSDTPAAVSPTSQPPAPDAETAPASPGDPVSRAPAPDPETAPAAPGQWWWLLLPLLGLPLLYWLWRGRREQPEAFPSSAAPETASDSAAPPTVPSPQAPSSSSPAGAEIPEAETVTPAAATDADINTDTNNTDANISGPSPASPPATSRSDPDAAAAQAIPAPEAAAEPSPQRPAPAPGQMATPGAALAGLAAAAGSLAGTGDAPPEEESQSPAPPWPRAEVSLQPLAPDTWAVTWSFSDPDQAAARLAGVPLMLKLHDATAIDLDQQPPHHTQTIPVDEISGTLPIQVTAYDRDYVAELGGTDAEQHWISLGRSLHARITAPTAPSQPAPEAVDTTTEPSVAPEDTSGSGPDQADQYAVGGDSLELRQAASAASLSLMALPRQALLAQWTLPDSVGSTLGDRQLPLSLRLYDATAIDLDQQPAHAVYDYPCQGLSSLQITAPAPERDYVAELGYYTPAGQWQGLIRSLHQRAIAAGQESAAIANAPEPVPAAPLRAGCRHSLIIDSQQHRYPLEATQWSQLEQLASTVSLQPGTYLICIEKGAIGCFGNNQPPFEPEPWVVIWLQGGRFIHYPAQAEATASWVILNGYADVLTLDVLALTYLRALVFNTDAAASIGRLSLLILPDA